MCMRICKLRKYVLQFSVRAVGGVVARAGSALIEFCRPEMHNCQTTTTTTTTKCCILCIQNVNLFTQDMSDPMFDKSRHVIHK